MPNPPRTYADILRTAADELDYARASNCPAKYGRFYGTDPRSIRLRTVADLLTLLGTAAPATRTLEKTVEALTAPLPDSPHD